MTSHCSCGDMGAFNVNLVMVGTAPGNIMGK